jgi:hypothetical protein
VVPLSKVVWLPSGRRIADDQQDDRDAEVVHVDEAVALALSVQVSPLTQSGTR